MIYLVGLLLGGGKWRWRIVAAFVLWENSVQKNVKPWIRLRFL